MGKHQKSFWLARTANDGGDLYGIFAEEPKKDPDTIVNGVHGFLGGMSECYCVEGFENAMPTYIHLEPGDFLQVTFERAEPKDVDVLFLENLGDYYQLYDENEELTSFRTEWLDEIADLKALGIMEHEKARVKLVEVSDTFYFPELTGATS